MTQELSGNLVMIAELAVQPDKVDEFLDYTTRNLRLSRTYPGNIQFDILVDPSRPDAVLFYEVWESAEAQQAYMSWRIQAGDPTTLMAFLAGPPKFTSWRVVGEPDQAGG